MNMYSILRDAAEQWGDSVAVVHNGRAFTYAQLGAAADSLASELTRSGVCAGDKVGLMIPSSPEAIVASFAVWRIGGIAVSIPTALKADEVRRLEETVGVDAFCYAVSSRPSIGVADGVDWALWEGRTPLRLSLTTVRRASSGERRRLREIDAAAIYFSSGTTADAKGVVLSHQSLCDRTKNVSQSPPVDHTDSLLWLHSTATVGVRVYLCLMRGAKLVLADVLDAEAVAGMLAEHGITQVYGTPLFYRAMVAHDQITAKTVSGISRFTNWSTSMPTETAERFHARFGREIVQGYGLRECGQVSSNGSEDSTKRGSVGVPCGKYQIRLAPADVADRETGELLVRGPGMFDAYYRPWRLREEVLKDGWFRTGDLARRDSDGYYWIVGRIKDVINVGGVKVFPREIEEALASHPAVEEAHVYRVAEPRFGEVPHAKVKLREGYPCDERELMRYVNDRLSVFKSIRRVEFVDALPKTVTGKLKRH